MIEDEREVGRRRRHGQPLVSHCPLARADVGRAPRQDVDLPRVGDRAHPSTLGRIEEHVHDLGDVALARAVRVRPVRVDRLRVAQRRRPVLAIDDRPQPEGVGRLLAHEPHARAAHPRRRRTRRHGLVGEPRSKGVRRVYGALDLVTAEAAARTLRTRRARLLLRRGLACVGPEEAGDGHWVHTDHVVWSSHSRPPGTIIAL